MHWHGFEIPHAMDGGPGASQDPIKSGGRFVYEFTLHQEGTFFYHSHMAMQEMMGMIGAFTSDSEGWRAKARVLAAAGTTVNAGVSAGVTPLAEAVSA